MGQPVAGIDFPWQYINGFYLRLETFVRIADMDGDRVGRPRMGAYGLAIAELPNPMPHQSNA